MTFFLQIKMNIPTVKSCCCLELKTVGLMIGFLQLFVHGLAICLLLRVDTFLVIPLTRKSSSITDFCKLSSNIYSSGDKLVTQHPSIYYSDGYDCEHLVDLWHSRSEWNPSFVRFSFKVEKFDVQHHDRNIHLTLRRARWYIW